jgi:hypothetical protein
MTIASYFLYKGLMDNCRDALEYFANKRSKCGHGVCVPSQKRYIYTHF